MLSPRRAPCVARGPDAHVRGSTYAASVPFDVSTARMYSSTSAHSAPSPDRSHSVETSRKRICLWLADQVAKARMNASLISLQSTNR